jgi:hypothetical protein
MDGFKNTTKTSYDTTSGRKFANGGMTVSRADMPGGEGPMSKPAMVAKYAKGGSVKKGEQKMAKVMGEFASGKLHSGSKKGPEVKNPKQAVAIAMSEARKAGAKMPTKKAAGGPVKMREGGTFNERGQRATMAELAAEDRRMAGRAVEGISTRPTDASGRRATDADLGVEALLRKTLGAQATNAEREALARRALGASATKAEIKALRDKTTKGMSDLERARMMTRPLPRKEGGGVPAHSDRPMIRRAMGGLSVMPKGGKC